MEKLNNIRFDDWSEKAISNPLMKGSTIEYLFPVKFEKYCKIFHPFCLSPDYEKMKDEYWAYSEEDNLVDLDSYLPKPLKILAQILGHNFDKRYSTEKIVSVFGRRQPKWFLYPAEGTLDSLILPQLTKLLSKYSKSQICYFHYVQYAISTYETTIFKGVVSELPKTVQVGFAGTPNTVWPESKEWYLYTNFDADYTLIGGRKDMINEILSSEEIEALEWDLNDIFYLED
ncbi:MAG: hypothetical protein U0U66_00180 [Cytophagaceae bacterium]